MSEVELECAVYGEGTVFPVKIASDAKVSALQEAIFYKKRYNERANIDASMLTLYVAKKKEGEEDKWLKDDDNLDVLLSGKPDTSYEKMRSSWRLNKDELLGPNFKPGDEEIHVLVELKEGAQFLPQDGVFDQCNDEFYSQFPTVSEVNSWLEFPSLLPLTERQQLYVRTSYKCIAEQALLKVDSSRRKYAVITGTPGIGKSVFVYYVMWKLIKDNKRVLFFSTKGPIYFDGLTMFRCKSLPNKFNEQFWSPILWCLVDSIDPTTMPELPIHDCSVLLVSTPRRDCIGEFKKLVPTPDVFYMPLWTEEELTAIAPLYPRAVDVWKNRFECLGGVPRLVLQDIETDPQALLMSACSSCSLDDCIMLVSIYSEINSKTKIIQTLIHMHSEEPYRKYNVSYASPLAIQVIARTKWQSDRAKMQNLLGSTDGNPLTQSLCGRIFEPHAIDLLEKGGTFKCRELFSGKTKKHTTKRRRNGDNQTIDIPESPMPRQIVDSVEAEQDANQLYVPKSRNYVGIDAWIGFQMTVGRTHDINGGAEDDLATLGNKLYFLLHPLYYKSFTKKTPHTINQFGILIPYPDEVK